MIKLIRLDEIQKNSKAFYETCSEINVLQRQLEQMLSAIEKNSREFKRGNISKVLFSHNEKKLKASSAVMIKKINTLVKKSISYTSRIDRLVDSQRIVARKFNRKKKIEEIKKIASEPPKEVQEAK